MSNVHYPILFTYRDILAGNGFVAGIEVRGRYLMAEEGEERVWIYGVNPGGLSAGGHSQKEATSAFREAYRETLFDIAGEAKTFEELSSAVSHFVNDENSYYHAEWWDAVALVRSGKIDLEWLDKKKAESELQVTVVKLSLQEEQPDIAERPAPSQNQSDNLAQAA